jgi:hypothetical protein
MKLSFDCMQCLLGQAFKLAGKHIDNDNERFLFIKKVLHEMSGIDQDTIAPQVAGNMHRIFRELSGSSDPYREEKDLYNKKMLSLEKNFDNFVVSAEDRLAAAVKLAAAGNVIDFGAVPDLDSSEVFRVIQETVEKDFCAALFDRMTGDLAKGKTLLYLGDNAGEIVLDKFLIREIKRRYPRLKIYFATRGNPVINDVTVRDAKNIGVDKYAVVIDNGADFPGTILSECTEDFRDIFNSADVIISKGQGNFESLVDNPRKIYFIFLCKCAYFEKKLGIRKHEIVFYCNRYHDH